jgi:hypothetical protein
VCFLSLTDRVLRTHKGIKALASKRQKDQNRIKVSFRKDQIGFSCLAGLLLTHMRAFASEALSVNPCLDVLAAAGQQPY